MKLESSSAAAGQRFRTPSLLAAGVLCTVIAGLQVTTQAGATPGAGVTPQPIAIGVLPEGIRTKLKADTGFESGTTVSNIAVVRFTIVPGGYFGWHRHGGPVWVVVEQGTLTVYDPHVAGCARTYEAGEAFLDTGDHVHNARNEGAVPAVVYGSFMLPVGGALRIDAPDPGGCVMAPL